MTCYERSRLDWRPLIEPFDAVVALAMALDRHAYKPEPVALVGWL